MGSLLDFGAAAQRAQQGVQNALAMENLGLHQRQTAVNEQQLAVNQQSEQNARLNSIRAIWQDPRIVHDQELSDQLFGAIAPMVGIPTDGLQEKLTQSHKDRQELMTATLGQDPQKAQAAVIKLMAGMEPDKAAVFLKNIESVPALHARAQIAKQHMEMNEAKFAELRQNQAIVNEGRGPLTAFSASLRRDTSVLDSPAYKNAVKISKTLNGQNILDPSSKHLAEKDKAVLQNLFTENANKKADSMDEPIKLLEYKLETASHALLDMQHGVKPVGNMREELTARIATLQPILGAQRDLQAFYRDPLNSEKATLAKHAYETIEARRVELEAMDKKLDATRQSLANLANEKFDYKQGQDNAVALGQQEYFALPDKQKTGQAAAQIAKRITEQTGVPVKVSDIVKDPTVPETSVKIDLTQEKAESKKVGEGFGEQFMSLQKADVDSRAKMAKYDRMDQLLKQMDTGRFTPTMTAIQSMAESLGFEVDKTLPAKQAFTAFAGEVALSLRNPEGGAGMPGALSEKDLAFLQSMTPDLAKTTAGNKLIIDTARKLAKRDQEIAKIARDYRKKHGQIDEGFYDQLAAYSDKNQLFADAPTTARAQPQGDKGASQPQGGILEAYKDTGKEQRYQKWLSEHPEYK
jgi:hypothetical protein